MQTGAINEPASAGQHSPSKPLSKSASKPRTTLTVRDILALVENSLDDDKAVDVVRIDLVGKTSIADFMVIASGQSHRQVGAMADHLLRKLKTAGVKDVIVEGQQHCDWVVVDTGDILVHLFRPEVRDFYNLEKLWSESLPDAAEA